MNDQGERICFQKALVAEFQVENGKATMTSVRMTATMYRTQELAELRYGKNNIVGMVHPEQTFIEFDAIEVAHWEHRYAGVVEPVVQNESGAGQ